MTPKERALQILIRMNSVRQDQVMELDSITKAEMRSRDWPGKIESIDWLTLKALSRLKKASVDYMLALDSAIRCFDDEALFKASMENSVQ